MKVSGVATLHASRTDVWSALNDPAVLVRTIPGCQRLERVEDDRYTMTLTAGVASLKGVYQGEVRLTDQQPPATFVLRAAGAGAPGTVSANVLVSLADSGDTTTELTYDADAVVGGMIGGVGQRMLTGVAKKTAGEFFRAVDDVLTGAASHAPADAAGVFEAPRVAPSPAGSLGSFRSGVLLGACAAVAGAVVGGWLAGRRRAAWKRAA